MKTSHTPGPWALGEFNEHLGYDCMTSGVRAGQAVLDGMDYGQKLCEEISEEGKARMLADARLIAAAPDLLASLEGLFEQCAMTHKYWGDGSNTKEADAAIAAARAAIAKAVQP
jgi:hypothetical protein